jgi:hypothetical protein
VGYYSQQADKKNDFQLIITDGNDILLPEGYNTGFTYGDMQWTTGSASGGTNGFGGTPATAGVNMGDGVNYAAIGRFNAPGYAYDGGAGSSDVADGPHAVILDQVENGVAVRMAVMYLLANGG